MTWPRQRLYPLRSLTSWTESRSQSRPDRSSPRTKGLKLIGTALYGALRRVVWDPGANYSRGPDSASDLLDVVARSMKSCTNRTSSILMVSNLFSPHIKVI